jgi:RND family efflux transporter MFP subunit
MNTIKRFLKNYKFSIPTGLVIIIAVIFFTTRGGAEVKSDFITVARTTVAQEVSVTGRVIPAEAVDLAVQSGGKVSVINVKVGGSVKAGATLLKVDDADLRIRLGRQQASLEKARLALTKQEPGAGNAQDDLEKAFEDGFNTIADTFLDIPSVVSGLNDILNDWRHSPELETEYLRGVGNSTMDIKATAVRNYSKARSRYDTLFLKYKSFTRSASPAELESMLNETYEVSKALADSVKEVRNLVDFVDDKGNNAYDTEIASDLSELDGYTKDMNTHLSSLLSIRNTIKTSRDQIKNETSDTSSSRIDIRQAELDIQDTLVQISNRTIKAPADGIVTKVETKVGETISPGTPVISIISEDQFQIEANVPEADMALIKPEAQADITLDAYGSDVMFKAKVLSIDPAETIIDGVATYKTKFQFVEKDERIKSGMTASIKVKGQQKENVFAVPQRAVVLKNSEKFVKVLNGEVETEKKVETGLRGSDGNIEIISGLSEGDKVVVFSQK